MGIRSMLGFGDSKSNPSLRSTAAERKIIDISIDHNDLGKPEGPLNGGMSFFPPAGGQVNLDLKGMQDVDPDRSIKTAIDQEFQNGKLRIDEDVDSLRRNIVRIVRNVKEGK